ncbi:MAG: redoxin domain-containing protein [Myxococcota bacterium]
MKFWFWGLLFASVVVAGCAEDAARGTDAAAARDAGAPDVAADVGEVDAGEVDAGEPDAAVCEPVCEGRSCGSDGCGGSCGACEGVCLEGTCLVSERCPPVGPFGTEEGEVAADAVLLDCEGNEVRLHALCDAEIAWVFEFADWCSSCRRFARDDVERLWQEYAAQGVAGYFVISTDADFNPATQELCTEVRDRYGLSMPVLFDPDANLQSALGIGRNAWNIILGEGMEIRWKARYSDRMVPERLDEALAHDAM